MAVEFYIHKMSEHMDQAEIIQWLAKEGDRVEDHQPIIEVMTDKFTVEVEAPRAGILAGIRPGCVAGALVPVGEAIAYIVQPGEAAPHLPAFGGAAAGTQAAEVRATEVVAVSNGNIASAEPEAAGRVKSTPVARRMARDVGVDIETLSGSGPGGRVVEADVRAAADARSAHEREVATPVQTPRVPVQAAPAQPPVSQRLPAQEQLPAPGGFSWQELTPVQRTTGERMRESIVNAPQFALELSADATNLLWLKDALDSKVTLEARARLSLTGLLTKIVAAALARHPRANAQFAEGKVKLLGDINVGVAIGTDQGLVAPVIRQADRKSLATVTAELAAYQEKARTMRFAAADLADGTFTISNLGMFGIERFAAIINPPQSAILAVGAVVRQPVARADGTVGVRPRMSLTLTVDHRVMDGVLGARFLSDLMKSIETPYFLI